MPRDGRRQGLAALAVTATLATAALAMPRHVDASPAPNVATRGQTSTFSPTGVGAPAIAVASDGTQLLFWGVSGHLIEAWFNGSWNGPVDWTAANGWPASVSSTPSVALAADGTQIIFWQAPGGHLDEVWWNGHWNGPVDWTAANGWPASLNSAPSAALAVDGTQIIFWQGTGGHLDEVWWNGHWNGPVDWTAANGWPASVGFSPSAALDPSGTQIIFWQGAGGHLYEAWWKGSWNGPVDWTAANHWPASVTAAPSVTFTATGTQLIFWRGAGSHLDEVWWNGQWNGPVDVTASFFGGNGLVTSAPSVAITPDSQQLVFWQGPGNTLWEAWYAGGSWHGPADWTPPPPFTFGDGTWRVGSQVPAGTYRTRQAAISCYWERLSGFGGTTGEIIANHFGDGYQVVTIAPSDAGFHTQSCGTWTSDLSATGAWPTQNGIFIVGTDLSPGTYSAPGGSSCYWARLSGFGGTTDQIIANGLGQSTVVVTITPTDAGFETQDCGTWSGP
jgi:hypothetical protein